MIKLNMDKKENDRLWRFNNKKKCKIYDWKNNAGLIGDYDLIYDKWLNATNCELCSIDFKIKKKCMDHDHKTGKFRNIICSMCNVNLLDMKKSKNNTSGYKHISHRNDGNKGCVYQRNIRGIRYRKRFKTITEALCYKFIMILKHN